MVDFKHNRSLHHNFPRLIVDKEHLYRLACLVANTADKYELTATFEIKTPNGEDTITTTYPEFFVSEFMPISTQTIGMSVRGHDSPIRIRLDFGKQNLLSVDGNDPERVVGTFSELKREIEYFEAKGELIANFGKTIIGWFLSGILFAAFIFSIFDIALDLAYKMSPEFRGSEAATTIVAIGWGLVFVSLCGAPIVVDRMLTKLYPPFEFLGGLSHSGLARRMGGGTIVVLVVLPIVINLISGFIRDGIYLWLQ